MIEFREETHQYFVDGVEKRYWSQIAQDAGLIQLPDHPAAQQHVINAKHRGRQIAQACCYFIRGQLDLREVHQEALPYVWAFTEWWNIHGCRDMVTETPLYHRELDYCVTPDLHTPRKAFEVKTGDRPSRSWGLQNTAQAMALGGERGGIIWLRPKLKRKKYEFLQPEDSRVYSVQDFEVVREAATGQYDGPAITVWKEGMR